MSRVRSNDSGTGEKADVGRRVARVRQRIMAACERAGRAPDDVRLVAVGKGHTVARLQAAYDAGVRDFGESYVQEWLDKVPAMPNDVRWHVIGRLQTNKARYIARTPVDLVHSVGREKLARALSRRAAKEGATLDVLAQVNVGDEDSKGGVDAEMEAVRGLIETIEGLPAIEVHGLMCIPPYTEDPEDARRYYERLANMRDRVSADTGVELRELSMGMSHDFEVAVEAGATIVRVGTALFGPRPG